MKLKYCLITILLPILSNAQTIIKGSVRSAASGKPIPGAFISSRTYHVTAYADQVGNFTLQLPALPDSFVISSIGYKSMIQPINASVLSPLRNNSSNEGYALTIFLSENAKALDTVVVSTGYQPVPKERATGSFDFIDNKLLNRTVSAGILSRIENITPGLLFNRGDAAATDPVLIRGRSTIYANAAPLVVLDNFPWDGDINSLNPNDIESVSILKDAAAASIWGARAGNGVIIINTKKGSGTRPRIQFISNITMQQKPDLFNISSITPADYIELEKFLFSKGHYTMDEQYDAWNFNHPPLTPVIELLIAKRDGTMPPGEADARVEEWKQFDARNDIDKHLYNQATAQQYAVNISGNSTGASYYMSVGYDKSMPVIKGSSEDRITLRSQNTFRLGSKISIDLGISLIQLIINQGNNPGINLNNGYGKALYPYARLVNDAGDPVPLLRDYRTSFIDDAMANGLLDWHYNPILDISQNRLTTKSNNYTINAGITYTIVNGLNASVKYQYQYIDNSVNNLHYSESYFARNLVNSFTQSDPSAGTLSFPVPKGAIEDFTKGSTFTHQGRIQLSYDHVVGNNNRITALLGWEIKDLHNKQFSGRVYGYDPERSIVEPRIDFVNQYTLYYNIYLRSPIPNIQSINETTDRFLSAFANAAYTIKNRYTFSASVRSDGANLFGVNTNQRFTPLWSAGFAWKLSNENFYNISWLPSLKFRATYGVSGNISRMAAAFTTVSFYGAVLTPFRNATILTPPNEKLRWEKVSMFNMAVDFAAKNNRITGTLEWYKKQANDLLGEAPIDPSTGLSDDNGNSFFYGNVASMKGTGIDLNINSMNTTGRINWQTTVIYSYSTSKITNYLMPSSTAASVYLQLNALYINPVKGKPVYSVYSYPWYGLDPQTGDPLGNLDDKPVTDYDAIANQSIDSIIYNGPAQPQHYGAVRNTFQWKRWSLSFNISYKLGYWFRKPSVNYGNLFSTWAGHGDYALRWQNPGDEKTTNVPSLVYPANPSRDRFYQYADVLVLNAGNIRLEDINLSYTITKAQWGNLPFNSLTCYVYASNLALLWKANSNGIDPYFNNTAKEGCRFSLGFNVGF